MRVLVYGFGNPGRLDDGLGPAMIAELDRLGVRGPNISLDSNYQLAIEDAALVAEHDVVIFVDAALEGPEPFSWGALEATEPSGFTSHQLAPEAVLCLARTLWGCSTQGYLLGIRGYEFDEFGERLSARARENLQVATGFLADMLDRRVPAFAGGRNDAR